MNCWLFDRSISTPFLPVVAGWFRWHCLCSRHFRFWINRDIESGARKPSWQRDDFTADPGPIFRIWPFERKADSSRPGLSRKGESLLFCLLAGTHDVTLWIRKITRSEFLRIHCHLLRIRDIKRVSDVFTNSIVPNLNHQKQVLSGLSSTSSNRISSCSSRVLSEYGRKWYV